jgi:serine phosphatase RsbU (regulator of sigma subunit)
MNLAPAPSAISRRSYEYFRDVPLARLTFLLLAIFCLFGMVGFLIDIRDLGRKPLAEALIWTLFTGGMAVFYLLTLIRSARWLPLPFVVHILGSGLIRSVLLSRIHTYSNATVDENGVRTAAMASLLLSGLAAVFFLQFIRSEGLRSVRLQTELSLAHGIQETLVPRIEKALPACEIYGVTIPSENVGGDLVDVVELKNGQVIAYVADIAGHGLPAGILMAMLKTAARTQLFDMPRLPAFFERLNDVLPAVKEPAMYATCAAVLLTVTGEGLHAEYALAGHPPILHLRPDSGTVERLEESQYPLGLLPEVSFTSHSFNLQGGDVLLITTDGIIETSNTKGEEFGLKRVEAVIQEHVSEPLSAIAGKLQSEVRAFGVQSDDQTILLLRVRRKEHLPGN